MARDDDLHDLTRHPILAALEPDALRFIALSAEQRILRSGEVLFYRDEPSDGGYFLRSGTVALETGGSETGKMVQPPALIGETALIAPTRRPATATAREPSGVLHISRALFQKALMQSPKSAERIRRLMEQRLRSFARDLDALRERALDDN